MLPHYFVSAVAKIIAFLLELPTQDNDFDVPANEPAAEGDDNQI